MKLEMAMADELVYLLEKGSLVGFLLCKDTPVLCCTTPQLNSSGRKLRVGEVQKLKASARPSSLDGHLHDRVEPDGFRIQGLFEPHRGVTMGF